MCCTFGVACFILHVARRTLLNLAHCLMLRRVLCVALCTSDAVSDAARCTPPLACCIFRVVCCTPPGRSASTRHVASTSTGCRRRRSRRPKTSSGSSTSAPTTAPPPPPTYAINSPRRALCNARSCIRLWENRLFAECAPGGVRQHATHEIRRATDGRQHATDKFRPFAFCGADERGLVALALSLCRHRDAGEPDCN